jgi:dihydroorotate dehydrogenase electron transfer subunit
MVALVKGEYARPDVASARLDGTKTAQASGRGVAVHRPVVEASASVVSNDRVNDRYKHLVLSLPPHVPTAQPGQFFHLLCPGQGEGSHMLRRPMSIYAATPQCVEFLYKVLGIGTRGLAALAPKGALNMVGPLGRGFRLEPGWRHMILAARGVGLATLAPLADAAAQRGIALTAILSAASPRYLMSVDRLRAAGADVITVTDAEGTSDMAQVEALLRGLIGERGCDCFATCGSQRLLALLQRLGRELAIGGQVALEQNIACGMGACFCCVRPFRVGDAIEVRRVCHEGPVFDLQETLGW